MASIPSLVRPSSSGWPREIHEKKERGKGLDRIAFDLNRRSRSRSGDFRPFKADGMVARLSRHPHPSPSPDISHKEGASGLCLSDNGFKTKTYRSTEAVPDADTV